MFTVFLDLKSERDCVDNAVFLKDFDPRVLKICKRDCGDQFFCYIDYGKNPLYLIIPEVIGYVKMYKSRRSLNFAQTNVNDNILSKYDCVIDSILDRINDSSSLGKIDKNYDNIKINTIGCGANAGADLPLDKLIKFSAMISSCKLLIETDGSYYPEFYLIETLYDDYWSM